MGKTRIHFDRNLNFRGTSEDFDSYIISSTKCYLNILFPILLVGIAPLITLLAYLNFKNTHSRVVKVEESKRKWYQSTDPRRNIPLYVILNIMFILVWFVFD